jgi:hypothetical protein
MRRPERSTYTPLDFMQWHEAGSLTISPKFQRRSVWSRAAQSFLIDTLLLGLPVPPIYLRIVQDSSRRGVVREVIDGQQRISAIISYMQDKYALSKNIESPCVGRRFSELTDPQKDAIAQFSFVCEVFYGVEDPTVLKIFARLNTHSVRLNNQELRNGKYFGAFKQTVYNLAFEHLEFWRNNRLFTEQAIARMNEVELTSELTIAMLDGIQDKKKSIDTFYARYDDDFPESGRSREQFRTVIDALNEAVGEDLYVTEFRRIPLFYSLFCATHHRMYGLPNARPETPQARRLDRNDREGLQEALRRLSEIITTAKEDEGATPRQFDRFVVACLRQTDNIRPREVRFETIYRSAFA